MPRPGHPWYRRGRSMWYANVGGKQTALGVTDESDEAGAVAVYRRLTESITSEDFLPNPTHLPTPPPLDSGLTVQVAVVTFLAKSALRGIKQKTVYDYRLALNPFVAEFGQRVLHTLEAGEVERWADRPHWSQSTQNTYLGVVQTLMKWAKVTVTIRRPAKESRGADSVLADEQFEKLLAGIRSSPRGGAGDFKPLLILLRETGARPQEIAALTIEQVDWPNASVRLKEHKTRRHGGERIIHFSERAMAILQAHRERHATGLLFPTKCGNRYKAATIGDRVRDASKRSGVKATAYGLGRHSFCTAALVAGVPDAVVAALVGHKGTTMLHRHYSHIGENARVMKAAIEQVSKAKGKAG
ncbi:MAG: hypothetical protein C0467_05950 [Planctomycetaceae bacterium]|nr:hypothetical protein [Planctomycetaceae bacterium]